MKYLEIFQSALYLGLTSFGGPVAHLGFFHAEYVEKRKWLDERSFAEIVALCQFLPGPASSQTGIAIGILRGNILGGFLAWLGFTLPAAVVMALFALIAPIISENYFFFIHALKVIAVAVVAHAVLLLWKKLVVTKIQASLALGALLFQVFFQSTVGQLVVIVLAGAWGAFFLRLDHEAPSSEVRSNLLKPGIAIVSLLFLATCFLLLPVARSWSSHILIALFDSFFRAGALVFGGGHVVLPLLQAEVVSPGWISEDAFLAGYGAAQAIPGPLFTISAYLGMSIAGIQGALVACLAIFLPSFLLVAGIFPFWQSIGKHRRMIAMLAAVNAAVVGILAAALYDPLWITAIKAPADFALAALLSGLLIIWKWPAWMVVVSGLLLSLIPYALGEFSLLKMTLLYCR